MDQHLETMRSLLWELDRLAAETERTERSILARAESRLAEVSERIEQLQAAFPADRDAAPEGWQALSVERKQLRMVIARARAVLGAIRLPLR